jgi:SAM-dependent methyltransferase
MTGQFDLARCRELYAAKLKPVLLDYKPLLELEERNEFYVRLLGDQQLLQPGKRLVDLGAGLSLFGPLCRSHGMDVTLVDDFGGGGGVELGQGSQEIPLLAAFEKQFGLQVARQNFLEQPLLLPDASADVVTCFHSLEHWHHSPRRLFREIVRILKPGGFLIIATPNAVNIRKRVYVLFGRTNFPSLREWYEDGDPVFRGHVREPVVRDLQQLMEWNGLVVIATYGRNFIGRQSEVLAFLPAALLETVAKGSDRLLRLFPSLCSDIHVIGRKP